MITRTTYEISGPDTLVRGMEVRWLKPLFKSELPCSGEALLHPTAPAVMGVADRSVRAIQTVVAHWSLLLSGWEAAGDDRGKFLDGDVEGFHGVWQ